jgi:ferredoxin
MAEITNKNPRNIHGPFYVDDTCIDCDICRENAPAFFRRDEETGFSYVWKQPETDTETALAKTALEGCPTDSIGKDEG